MPNNRDNSRSQQSAHAPRHRGKHQRKMRQDRYIPNMRTKQNARWERRS